MILEAYVGFAAVFWGFYVLCKMHTPRGSAKDPNWTSVTPRSWGWTFITFALEHTFWTISVVELPLVLLIVGKIVPCDAVSVIYTLFFPAYVLSNTIVLLIIDSWICDWEDLERDMEASKRLLTFSDKTFEKQYGTQRIPISEACQAYLDGKLDFKDPNEVFKNRYGLFRFAFTKRHLEWFATNVVGKTIGHDHSSDLADITGVYNRGNDFYHLFMGDTMLYSSGIFNDKDESLEAGQARKLDSIAKICQLKPGMKHLDLGCGWGTLLAHFGKEYRTESRGITLSGEQAKFCRERIEACGCSDNAKVDLMNFWDLKLNLKYDVITCLEMSEHIGIAHYSKFLSNVHKLLADDGTFYLQIAGLRRAWQYEDFTWGLFMGKYIFPGADASCPLAWVVQQCERAGFEIRRTHNLGVHYGLTIEKWLNNWVKNEEVVIQKYGKWWYRLWCIFLAWSAGIAKQGSSTVWFISMRKNFRCDKASVVNAPGVPEPFQDRIRTDVGPNLLGTESGRDFTVPKPVWKYDGATNFVHVKTHIDPKNLKVHDDVGDNQELDVDYSLMDKFFFFAIMAMGGMMVLQICNLIFNNSMLKLEEISLGLICALFFLFTRFAFVWLSRPLMHKFAAGFDNTRVVQEMADCLYQAIYFSIMVIIGYIHLKDEPYFPSCLGGTGNIKGMQIAEVSISEGLTSYYNVQVGYYIHCLLYLYFNKRKSYTLMMVLYSQVAVFLSLSAYSGGFKRLGVVLLFLHDVGNALASLLNVLKEGEQFLSTIMVFSSLMPIWMYTRLYLMITIFLPRMIEMIEAKGGKYHLLFLPVSLLLMSHVYGFFSLGHMGIEAVIGGNSKLSN
jgi:cyclopropane fatty-acyl-phospholipid synthase-like methyltransferase